MIGLKRLREERGIDQKVLAIDLNVSQPTISDWENGRKTPSVDNLVRLADYFSVSLDCLLGRVDQKETPAPTEEDGQDELEQRLTALLSQATDETKQAMLVLLEQLQKPKETDASPRRQGSETSE